MVLGGPSLSTDVESRATHLCVLYHDCLLFYVRLMASLFVYVRTMDEPLSNCTKIRSILLVYVKASAVLLAYVRMKAILLAYVKTKAIFLAYVKIKAILLAYVKSRPSFWFLSE